MSSSVESSSLSSSSSQFTIKSPPSWHRSAKSRSFRKTIRALPRSPRKKNCVKSFASIFIFAFSSKITDDQNMNYPNQRDRGLKKILSDQTLRILLLGKTNRNTWVRSMDRVNTLKSVTCCGTLKYYFTFWMEMPPLTVKDSCQNSLRISPFAKCMILSKFTLNLFVIRTYHNQAVCVKCVRMLHLSQKV